MTDLFDLREASIHADRYKVYSDERGKMAGIIYAAIAANKALKRENELLRAKERTIADMDDALNAARAKLSGMMCWLEQNQPDVFKRGIWDAIDAALAQDKP